MSQILASNDVNPLCPVYAPFFGAMGVTAAIVFTCTYTSRHEPTPEPHLVHI